MKVMTMPPEQLQELPEAVLRRYFEHHARYARDMPAGNHYFIRFGGMNLFASSTHKLWEEFEKAVRNYQGKG